MPTSKNIQSFKTKLEKERELLKSELSTVGVGSSSNPNNPNAWEATAGGMEVDTADENEVADKMEELEENELILGQLDKQLTEVNAALEKMEKGTYGICETCGGEIEKERLEAMPSARTCIKDMKSITK